ncbi:MAG: hypothetical protein WAV54_13285 [Acidimicrobiales bacterium]
MPIARSMSGHDHDYSDLEGVLYKENDYLLLGFNGGRTYVPLQAIARVETPFLYDPIAEGQLSGPLAASASTNGITGNTFQTALQLGSSNVVAKPTDIFDLSRQPAWLYQMFLGIDPPWLRVFLQQPFRVDQRSLPIVYYTPSYPQEGFWDGYMSPPERPSRKTQIIVPPGLSIALGYANIEPYRAFPLLYFYINALNVAVVTDPDLAWEMLSVPKKAKIVTVAGLAQVQYTPEAYYGITGFPLTTGKGVAADKAAVAKGVTPVNTPIAGTQQVG